MLFSQLKALPRTTWVLFAGAFINRFGNFVVAFLVLYMLQRGYSIFQAGLAASIYGLGSIVASGVGGYLADRLGRRNTIALSMFGAAAVLLLLSQLEQVILIIVFAGLAGLAAEMYRPATSALLTDLIPANQRVTGFALYRLAINAGVAAGPAVGGLLADHSFFLLFLGDAVTSFFFGAIVLLAMPAEQRYHYPQHHTERFFSTIRSDRRFLLFLAASTAIAFVYFQSLSTLALHVRESGLSSSIYGALLSLNGLMIVLLELPLTTFSQRLPARWVMSLGLLLIGVGFGLTAVARTVPTLIGTVVIWTLGEMLNAPIAAAHIATLAPAHLRGRYQGIWGLTAGAGLIGGPALGTQIFIWSPQGLWIVCGILGVLASLLVFSSQTDQKLPASLPLAASSESRSEAP